MKFIINHAKYCTMHYHATLNMKMIYKNKHKNPLSVRILDALIPYVSNARHNSIGLLCQTA